MSNIKLFHTREGAVKAMASLRIKNLAVWKHNGSWFVAQNKPYDNFMILTENNTFKEEEFVKL